MTEPIPGSGALTRRERELLARVHTIVTVEAGTVLAKPLRPGSLVRYLRSEVSAGRPGGQPPFDYRTAGGIVGRQQDVAELRTPGQLIRAFRLDYEDSPFVPDLPVLHVLEFAATQPAQLVIPLGAPCPTFPKTGSPPNLTEARVIAKHMVAAATAAGVDPDTTRMELNPWPFTGTGLTADPDTGIPVRWRRYAPLPAGAVIIERRADGTSRPVAEFGGGGYGWREP